MSQTAYLKSKPHYAILDGLRGVASVLVVAFHLLESFTTSHADQLINHGYLAVDFFFILSGFVIGYAYDDRWGKMSVVDFVKRRLVRLQPMVVMGMIVGAAFFYFGASETFPLIAGTPVWKVLVFVLLGCFMIPVTPSMDIRGWWETYPLNGPAWSLMFEYIANILYMLVLRHLPKLALGVLVALAAAATVHLAVTSPNGDLIGGWALNGEQLYVGFVRLAYPFLMGLLMARMSALIRVRAAFWVCTLCLVTVFAIPRVGGEQLWVNGLYDAFSVIVLFPLIVAMGAGGKVTGRFSTQSCKFLGDISYPLYITHFPMVYIYTAWVRDTHPELGPAVGWGVAAFVGCIALGYLCLRFYDLPVRAWLSKRFLEKKA